MRVIRSSSSRAPLAGATTVALKWGRTGAESCTGVEAEDDDNGDVDDEEEEEEEEEDEEEEEEAAAGGDDEGKGKREGLRSVWSPSSAEALAMRAVRLGP